MLYGLVKKTTEFIRKLKGERPITAITAYDYFTARYADAAGVDVILVGDSVGNTALGFSTTVPVTVDMMLHHTAAVVRAQPNAFVVADIPFGVAHRSIDVALDVCVRFIQEAGADGVKIEGGVDIAELVGRLTAIGIPVLGHVGLLPQRVLQMGGYRKYGKNAEESDALLKDAQAIEAAGAFAIVGEMITRKAVQGIVDELEIPIIGIGSGPYCDGQILVMSDVVGMGNGRYPSFSKQYANMGEQMVSAVSAYVDEVKNQQFPRISK